MGTYVLLTGIEGELVRRCLAASVDGPFFPDWEFETLFGLTRDEVREVLDAWSGAIRSRS